MSIHSNILAWKIPWTEEPSRLQSMEWQRVGHDRATSFSFSFFLCIGINSLLNPWRFPCMTYIKPKVNYLKESVLQLPWNIFLNQIEQIIDLFNFTQINPFNKKHIFPHRDKLRSLFMSTLDFFFKLSKNFRNLYQ